MRSAPSRTWMRPSRFCKAHARELAQAAPNKGGHRERALELIDHAIGQVREGIAFAATH